ncbi:MAG: hypothetical protein ACRDI3_06400 [Actinomycetota bacterium]
MLFFAKRTQGRLRACLTAGAIIGFFALAQNFGRPNEFPVWFNFYLAIIFFGFFFATPFLILSAWAWAKDRDLFIRVASQLGVGLVVAGLIYGLVVAPLAWALFRECLIPTVEYQGECRYKP